MFRKWLEESTPLYCELSLLVGSAGIEGRVVSATDALVVVRSDDGSAELHADIGSAVCFGFGDTREVPAESDRYDAGVIVFFGDPDESEDSERASFVELRARAN